MNTQTELVYTYFCRKSGDDILKSFSTKKELVFFLAQEIHSFVYLVNKIMYCQTTKPENLTHTIDELLTKYAEWSLVQDIIYSFETTEIDFQAIKDKLNGNSHEYTDKDSLRVFQKKKIQ